MRYLGLDLGTKSLGLAISDKSNMISLPFNTLHFKEENYQDVLLELDKIVKEKEITAFPVKSGDFLELIGRFELPTSSLPRMRPTY